MYLAIMLGPARYEYYRFLGGDLRRRGEPALAPKIVMPHYVNG